MTGRLTSLTLAVIASLLVWTILAQWVMGDSRQRCEAVHSIDTCQWELR